MVKLAFLKLSRVQATDNRANAIEHDEEYLQQIIWVEVVRSAFWIWYFHNVFRFALRYGCLIIFMLVCYHYCGEFCPVISPCQFSRLVTPETYLVWLYCTLALHRLVIRWVSQRQVCRWMRMNELELAWLELMKDCLYKSWHDKIFTRSEHGLGRWF